MSTHASLRALRAFIEVARHRTVASAARQLGTSPSSVSHLLRDLEESLGIALFQPGSRRGALTEAGERLSLNIGGAFDTIDRAVSDLLRDSGEVRVSTLSSFATLWLVPRLAGLQVSHPALRVLVSTGIRPVDLATEPFDCAIRWGLGGWPDTVEVPLLREELVAVAGPGLFANREPPSDGADLLAFPRVAARSRPEDWPLLLTGAGCSDDPARAPGLVFETRALAVRAAIAGLGVAVVDRNLVPDALREGHLIQVIPTVVARPEAHFFVARPQALRDKGVCRFRDWLVQEAMVGAERLGRQ